MAFSEKFCLKWNDFQDNIASSFRGLREDFDFADVTLVCEEDLQIEAHKVILSACSPFFSTVLKRNKHSHPLIYMRGLKSKDLAAIVDFIYNGEANIFQEDLDSFLALADELKLKGLTGSRDEAPNTAESTETINATQIQTPQTKAPQIQKKIFPKTEEAYTYPNTEEPKYQPSKDIVPLDSGKMIIAVDSNSEDLQAKIESMMESTSDEDFKWRCTMCGKTTKKRQEMTRHIESHIDGVTHPCNQCDKVSRSSNALIMHKSRTHRH